MRILLLILVTTYAQAQQINFEQKAFNHFASEIISANYQAEKCIYFTGYSETQQSIAGPFAQCFKSDQEFEEFFYQNKKINSRSIPIDIANFSNVKASKKPKPSKLNLKIYRAVVNDDKVYVYIKVFKMKHFVDHYLIKISSNSGEVVDVCRINEII